MKLAVLVTFTCETSTAANIDQVPKITVGSGCGVGILKLIVANPLLFVVFTMVAKFVPFCVSTVNATSLLATDAPLEVTLAVTDTRSPHWYLVLSVETWIAG